MGSALLPFWCNGGMGASDLGKRARRCDMRSGAKGKAPSLAAVQFPFSCCWYFVSFLPLFLSFSCNLSLSLSQAHTFCEEGLISDRFLASLPSSRQASADFSKPVFTAVAFYLCAKKHKLKIDKVRLIEVCGISESEFSCVSTSMKDLCHDVFGISSEKKDPKEVKGNRELLDVLPEKRKFDDGGYLSDGPEVTLHYL
ncbi:origin of replication complex subunit 6 [Gossypium hirsutum]|uniref:Origin of replication complex subunit 6 n=1 Tax=Gossypium hirsutum TaxID=3635 RepID=A0A1U8LK52_GOSHI|nr:origin of replication complex subunit 6-like [Gossypium hirsutum]